MELKNINTFIKITELNSFTKAANELGYSQAAVTAQIKQLEKELETVLFDRLGRSIALTEAGRKLLPHAYDMQKAAEAAMLSIREKPEITGELRIGASSSTSMGKIPGMIKAFKEGYPKVTISVRSSDYIDDLLNKLKQGEVDFLLLLDEPGHYSDFKIIQETKEQVGFVTYAGNPLLKKKKIPLSKIAESQLIMSDRDSSYSLYLDRRLGKLGMQMMPAVEMSSIAAIVELLLQGYGVGFIPLFMAETWIKRGELALLDTEDPEIEVRSQLFCHKGKWINPQMRAFIDFLSKP